MFIGLITSLVSQCPKFLIYRKRPYLQTQEWRSYSPISVFNLFDSPHNTFIDAGDPFLVVPITSRHLWIRVGQRFSLYYERLVSETLLFIHRRENLSNHRGAGCVLR